LVGYVYRYVVVTRLPRYAFTVYVYTPFPLFDCGYVVVVYVTVTPTFYARSVTLVRTVTPHTRSAGYVAGYCGYPARFTTRTLRCYRLFTLRLPRTVGYVPHTRLRTLLPRFTHMRCTLVYGYAHYAVTFTVTVYGYVYVATRLRSRLRALIAFARTVAVWLIRTVGSRRLVLRGYVYVVGYHTVTTLLHTRFLVTRYRLRLVCLVTHVPVTLHTVRYTVARLLHLFYGLQFTVLPLDSGFTRLLHGSRITFTVPLRLRPVTRLPHFTHGSRTPHTLICWLRLRLLRCYARCLRLRCCVYADSGITHVYVTFVTFTFVHTRTCTRLRCWFTVYRLHTVTFCRFPDLRFYVTLFTLPLHGLRSLRLHVLHTVTVDLPFTFGSAVTLPHVVPFTRTYDARCCHVCITLPFVTRLYRLPVVTVTFHTFTVTHGWIAVVFYTLLRLHTHVIALRLVCVRLRLVIGCYTVWFTRYVVTVTHIAVTRLDYVGSHYGYAHRTRLRLRSRLVTGYVRYTAVTLRLVYVCRLRYARLRTRLHTFGYVGCSFTVTVGWLVGLRCLRYTGWLVVWFTFGYVTAHVLVPVWFGSPFTFYTFTRVLRITVTVGYVVAFTHVYGCCTFTFSRVSHRVYVDAGCWLVRLHFTLHTRLVRLVTVTFAVYAVVYG